MSLSLIMTARSSDGESLWRLAEVATASATRRHWEGAQAGVCHRIFSFTAQIVLVRQLAGCAAESVAPGAVPAGAEVSPAGPSPAGPSPIWPSPTWFSRAWLWAAGAVLALPPDVE